jgi:predicted nicotinamide N-methyase
LFWSDWDAGVGGGRWSGAAVLAEYICGAPAHALRGVPGGLPCARVLELGAGTGLCGIALAAAGAAHVLVTDVRPAVPLMAANCALNALPNACAAPLDW